MSTLFDRHGTLLDKAVAALGDRGFWTPFPEVPSGKIYGTTAREDGLSAYTSKLGTAFSLEGHPESLRVGGEVSPWGPTFGITYPATDAETLVSASEAAGTAWAMAAPETRVGLLLEALTRLNARVVTRRSSSSRDPSFLSARGQNALNGRAERVPLVLLVGELPPSERGQSVELRAAVVVRSAPFGTDPPLVLEAVQGWVKGSLVDLEDVVRDLLDAHGDTPPVHRLTDVERLQDEELEGPLQQVRSTSRHVAPRVPCVSPDRLS
jgi:hypothetical protein